MTEEYDAGGVAESRVDQIRFHEAEAHRLRDQADCHRWEAARLITAEIDTGKSHRQLAEEIDRSHVHVGAMARVWRQHGGNHDYQRQSFNELYRVATGQASQDKTPEFEPVVDGARLDQRKTATCPSCGCALKVSSRGEVRLA